MRHSLHSHIIYLENKVQSLRDRCTGPRLTAEEMEEVELQLSLSELALARYREAYALEIQVAGPEPSGYSPASSGSSSGTTESVTPHKGSGLAARSRLYHSLRRRKRNRAERQARRSASRRQASVAAR